MDPDPGGGPHPAHYKALLEADIRPAIFTMEQAKPLSDLAVQAGKTASIHLALDTGMSRIGMTPDEAGADLAAAIACTAWATGSRRSPAPGPTRRTSGGQGNSMSGICILWSCWQSGDPMAMKHCANSAAILDLPEMGLDLVRAGVSIYGLYRRMRWTRPFPCGR